MKIKSFLRGDSFAAVRAATSMVAAGAAYAASQPVLLPTGAWITPDAAPGSVFQPLTVALPDYPNFEPDSAQTTAVSPDGKTLLILTSGYNLNLSASGSYQPQDSSEFVFVYDISSPRVPVEKQVVLVPNAFSGLVWSPDGTKFYVAGGQDDNLHTYAQSNGQWTEVGTPISLGHKGDLMNLETQVGPTAGGVGITADGNTVIVANYETDSITLADVVHGAVLKEFDLRPGRINPAQSGVPGGEFPFGVAVAGNNTIYVSSARDREIDVLNLNAGALTVTKRIAINGNPTKMILNKAQSQLYVAVANADALVIINTAANTVASEVNVSAPTGFLGDGKTVPKGSNPNSVALSPDEQTAYLTNGGTNEVAVIKLRGKPIVTGLIPTGWQPNSVSVSPDNSTLYVVNGKSDPGPDPLNCRFINGGGNYGSNCQSPSAQNGSGNEYAFQNTKAGFLVLPMPSPNDLSQLTRLVAENNGFKLRLREQDISTMRFLRQHIQHVIYIVKENRTYDQILGDLTNGSNGDPTLTQFPSFVTPNFHKLATNFVTFDNFYDSGIVSMDGWQWSTAARALDLNEKSVVINYGKGGANYDSEGTARNINVAVTGVAARKAWQALYPNDPDLLPGTRNEVAADSEDGQEGLGYIWDAALAAHLSIRNYGFFLDLGAVQGLDPNLTDPCSKNPQVRVAFPAHTALLTKTDPCFRGFDQAFPDFFRYQEWAREFDNYVKHNNFPAFELLRFNHDHFGSFGTASFGLNTPELQIADDDYAVGLAIDKIAHSPYANNTLVFVIEDDPQDGADHVSGQRSVGFIIGPYVKHHAVVSTHYATVNMLRTIEEVLGLDNLSVHDAGVPPMTDAFDTDQEDWTYRAVPAQILYTTPLPIANKYVVNKEALPHPTHDAAWWAAKTQGFDFSREDRIDSAKFNRIIWEGIMGDKPYPTTRSGANLGHASVQLKPISARPQTREITKTASE
jgi:DNA-binding beta-propeller fold protein YncE